MQEIDFVELKRQSKRAAITTAVGSVIVVSAFLISYVQLNRMQHQLSYVRSEIGRESKVRDELTKGNEQLQVQERRLLLQNDKLSNIVNAYTNSPTISQRTVAVVAKEVSQRTNVSSVPPLNNPQVTIHIAPARSRTEAEIAAKILREKGYTVLGIVVETPENSPHQTTIRYFSYDIKSITQAKIFVELLTHVGFRIRPEYDEEFVGKANAPALGTFELWIGLDPSYYGVTQLAVPTQIPPTPGKLSPTQERLMSIGNSLHAELTTISDEEARWNSSAQYAVQQNFAEYRREVMSGNPNGIAAPRGLRDDLVKRLAEQNQNAITNYVNGLPLLIKNREEAISLMNLLPREIAEDSQAFAKANAQAQVPLTLEQLRNPSSGVPSFTPIEQYLRKLIGSLYVHP